MILYGTVPDTVYSIYSKPNLSSTTWTFEKHVTGQANEDWTDTYIPMNGRPMLFLRAGSSSDDSDGDGLSDAEELFVTGTDPGNPDTGNTGIADAYKDPDGDQWTNIDEIRNGTSPNGWDAPPGPRSFTVTPGPGYSAVLNWEPASGPVLHYTIEKVRGEQITVSSLETSFVTSPAYESEYFFIRAVYGSGPSLWTGPVYVADYTKSISGHIIRGPGGKVFLVCAQIPGTVTTIRVHRRAWWSNRPLFRFLDYYSQQGVPYEPAIGDGYFDLPVTEGGSSVFELPEAEVPEYGEYYFNIQGLGADGTYGPRSFMPAMTPQRRIWSSGFDVIPLLDGRRHLKENLIYELRGARGNQPFQVGVDWWQQSISPDFGHGVNPDVIASGFHVYDRAYGDHALAEFSPFEVNGFYSNFVFNVNHLKTDGTPATGADWDSVIGLHADDPTIWFRTEVFIGGPDRAVPTALSVGNSKWILDYSEMTPNLPVLNSLGISRTVVGSSVFFSMAQDFRNYYGLPFSSAKIVLKRPSGFQVYDLAAGGQVEMGGGEKDFYIDVQPPQFVTEQFLLMHSSEPMPGNPSFVPQPTKPVITSVGKHAGLAAWAKLTLQNGDPSKQIYLQQYFDKAYKANPDGTRSPTETGVLSEYGEFFPTEPGRAILTTKPDIDTEEVGACTVHVIKLSVDANHDGEMDETFSGPDQTTEARPFRFWVNNDYDGRSPATGFDYPGEDYPPPHPPDYRIEGPYARPVISCMRDLEDFARLWVSGVSFLTPDREIKLNWKNVTGSPAINVFNAVEADGGTRFLTDANIALQQTEGAGMFSAGQGIGQVLPGNSLILPGNAISSDGHKYFLFEGAGIGQGELVLSVSKGGVVLAESSIWLDLRDILPGA